MERVISMENGSDKNGRFSLAAIVLAAAVLAIVVWGCQNGAGGNNTGLQNIRKERESDISVLQAEIQKSKNNNDKLMRQIKQCREAKEAIRQRERDFYVGRSEMLKEFGDTLRIGTPRILTRPMSFSGEGVVMSEKFLKEWNHVNYSYKQVTVKPYEVLYELPLDTEKGYWLISDASEKPLDFDFDASAVEILIKGEEIDRKLEEIGIVSLDMDGNGRCVIGSKMIYPLNVPGIMPDWKETPRKDVYLFKLDFNKAFGTFRIKAGQHWGILLPGVIGDNFEPPHVPCDYLGTGDVRIAVLEKVYDNMEVLWKSISGKVLSQEYLLDQTADGDSRRKEGNCRASLKPAITMGLYGFLAKEK